MPRRSRTHDGKPVKLDSKSSRKTLPTRSKPYTTPIRPGLLLGYLKRGPGAGRWVVVERKGEDENGTATYGWRSLGIADDIEHANCKTVLDYAQAMRAAGDAVAPAGPVTVRTAAAVYLKQLRASKGARAESDAKQKLDSRVLPPLGDLRIADLNKTRIEQWHASMVMQDADDPDAERRSRDSANRVLSTLKAVLNHAFADDSNKLTSDAAWRKVKPFKNVGRAREDHFAAAQVRTLIAKAGDRHFADLLAGLFLTGLRYGEAAACDVRHLDGHSLTVPSGKTGARPVTLTDEAAAFLKKLAGKRAPGEPLFARTDDGARWGKSEQHRPIKRALKAAELPESASVYTLRHSHISRSIEAGVPLTLIAENCGTSLRMIEVNYAKVIASTRQKLLQKAGPALRLVATKRRAA